MYLGTSSKYTARKSKREMLAAVERTRDASFDILSSKTIARNTMEYRIRYNDGTEALRVMLHSTDVFELQFTKSGKPSKVKLDSGGWKTPTTKERINNAIAACLPKVTRFYSDGQEYQGQAFWITSDKGKWYVAGSQWISKASEARCLFVDGAWFKPDGTPLAPSLHRESTKQQESDEKLLKAYLAKIKKEGVPAFSESKGDPFVAPDHSGKYQPDMMRQWLKEKYVFLSLVANAMKWSGTPDPGFYLQITAGMRDENTRGKLDARNLQRVRRFIRACLGYAV